jgi:hypothetical protein
MTLEKLIIHFLNDCLLSLHWPDLGFSSRPLLHTRIELHVAKLEISYNDFELSPNAPNDNDFACHSRGYFVADRTGVFSLWCHDRHGAYPSLISESTHMLVSLLRADNGLMHHLAKANHGDLAFCS